MPTITELIEICKFEIAEAATCANLNWQTDDIVSVHDDDFGDVVFLRRFNPHEAMDENGDKIIKDGKPVIVWNDTMWTEYLEDKQPIELYATDGGRIMGKAYSCTFRVNTPRLVCIAPWLVRIVTREGEIKRDANDWRMG